MQNVGIPSDTFSEIMHCMLTVSYLMFSESPATPIQYENQQPTKCRDPLQSTQMTPFTDPARRVSQRQFTPIDSGRLNGQENETRNTSFLPFAEHLLLDDER